MKLLSLHGEHIHALRIMHHKYAEIHPRSALSVPGMWWIHSQFITEHNPHRLKHIPDTVFSFFTHPKTFITTL